MPYSPAYLGIAHKPDSPVPFPVAIQQDDRTKGLYIIGQMGTGKSSLISYLATMDIGESALGACVIDPHGDLIHDIIGHEYFQRKPIAVDRWVLLDPTDWQHPFGLNLFDCPDRENPMVRDKTVDYVMNVFLKLWGADGINPSWGINIQDLLSHVAQTFVALGDLTLVDIPLFLENEKFRHRYIDRLRPSLRYFWEQYDQRSDQLAYRSSTLNKVRVFTDKEILYPIIGQVNSTISIKSIMEEGKALLVKLPEGQLGREVCSLIGMLVIGQILNYTLGRVAQVREDRKPFSLYCDEFQHFATPDFAQLFTEGRKFGIQTTVAHQARFQLDQTSKDVTASVANRIAFRVSPSDVSELSRWFHLPKQKPQQEMQIMRHPIEFLLRNGHPDPKLRRIIEEDIRPLHELRGRYRISGMLGTHSINLQESVKHLFNLVDALLCESMTVVASSPAEAARVGGATVTSLWTFARKDPALYQIFARTSSTTFSDDQFNESLKLFVDKVLELSLELAFNPLHEPVYRQSAFDERETPEQLSATLTGFPVGKGVIHYLRKGVITDTIFEAGEPTPTDRAFLQQQLEQISSYAHQHYTRPREQVEREILHRHRMESSNDRPTRLKRTT